MAPRPSDHEAFRYRVVEALRALQPGEVVSYGEIAAEAGRPGAARAVVAVLRATDGCPWWRVVNAQGRLAPGLIAEQTRLLAAEGVPVRDGRVARPRPSRTGEA